LQLDGVGAQEHVKHAIVGESEEGVFIGQVCLYLHLGNYAVTRVVTRAVYKFLSWVHRPNILPLKIPGNQSISEMCFRSFFPKPLLTLMEELVMMTIAPK